MTDTPRFIIILALIIIIQVAVSDITGYYQIVFSIFKGKMKPTYMDIIFFILLFPFIIFMYIDNKIIEEKNIKIPCGDKICKWLNTIKK